MSSTVSHRESCCGFKLASCLWSSCAGQQIDNERRSPAQGVAELPRENSTPRKARLDRPAIERLNEFERDPELPVMRR